MKSEIEKIQSLIGNAGELGIPKEQWEARYGLHRVLELILDLNNRVKELEKDKQEEENFRKLQNERGY